MCFALFASAFNLLLGYGGLLSFGHAAFFGGSAYVTAHALKVWEVNPEFAILAGVAAALVLGLIMGLLAVRRQGIYFAMVTLALAQMFYFFCLQAPFTHGEDGIQGFSRGRLFGVIDLADSNVLYYVIAIVFVASIFAIWRIVHSPYGIVLQAIRENEQRAISLGYSVQRYKLGAFVMSAGFAGLAGGLKAILFQFATLTDVNWHMSGEVILMTLLGGIGSIAGPIVGAGLVVTLQNYFATTGFPVTTALGATFIVCVLLFRRGIVGEFRHRFAARRKIMSDALFRHAFRVLPDWVDYNGHMGDFAYGIVFSRSATALMEEIGLDEAYRAENQATLYTLEMRIGYQRECHEGDAFTVATRVLAVDAKRMHLYQEMLDESGERLAWCEQVLLQCRPQHRQAEGRAVPSGRCRASERDGNGAAGYSLPGLAQPAHRSRLRLHPRLPGVSQQLGRAFRPV